MHFVSYSHLWSWSRHCWSWLQVCVLITGRWKCGSCGSDMPWSRWCFKWCGCSLGTRHWRSSSSCRSRRLALNLVPISSVFWRLYSSIYSCVLYCRLPAFNMVLHYIYCAYFMSSLVILCVGLFTEHFSAALMALLSFCHLSHLCSSDAYARVDFWFWLAWHVYIFL